MWPWLPLRKIWEENPMGNTTASAKRGFWAATLDALFSAAGVAIVWMLKQAFRVAAWLTLQGIRHPRTTLNVGTLSGLVVLVGWQYVAAVIGAVLLTGSIWKAAHRDSFERTVATWLRTWHRRWWTYRRRWESVLSRCGLVVQEGEEVHVPKLKKVSTTPYWDRLVLKMEVGQEQADYDQAREKLRHAFGGERLAVRELEPGIVGLDLMRRDPFRHVAVPPAPMPAETAVVDWRAIRIGVTEHLEPLTVSVVGGHTVIMGMTGAGKAGLEWNILRGLAPAIADGTCKPIFVDPKAMELRQGLDLIEVGVYGTEAPETMREKGPETSGDYAVTAWDTLRLFERIVAELEAANASAGEAGERDFVPSKRTPLRPIFIDELAPALAYWPRAIRDRLLSLMGIVLTQGRAAGYIMIACIQETTKDIFVQRDLYARRIGLRLPTEDHTDAALTDNAVDRGAECHRIPESLPGVLFAFHESDSAAVRGRMAHVQDEHIGELVAFVQELRERNHNVVPIRPEVEYEVIEAADAGRVIEGEEGAA